MGNRLKEFRNKAGLTQAELAERARIPQRNYLSKLENGTVTLSEKWAIKLAPVLGCTPAELIFTDSEMRHTDPPVNIFPTQTPATIPMASDMKTDLPVFGTVECGDSDYMEFTDTFLIKRPPVWIGRDDVYAVRASGESMVPRFFPGEIVLVDTRLKPRRGNDVIVQLHDGSGDSGIRRAMLKVYIKKSPTLFVFSSYNPDYDQHIEVPVDQVKSVDVVVPAGELLGG
ncbi:MAG: helix-turn-helix domain-containing protein [Rhodospirillales bacterium]|nr:helix-turn-helix domain-containing protein [Rhodospirillales bacterium]